MDQSRTGGRGRGQKNDRGRGTGRRRRTDMGRSDWSRKLADKTAPDKRARTDQANKRRKVDGGEANLPVYATSFSKEEIEAEGRKPKKKVAVMLGYSGSGYKGMQLNHHEKTIEGDLFSAFVAAGAISKANADDPKKSSLVRCARTDRGVHAAGNVISLKMIIEDPAIVEKINEKLSSQIRVWGIERTNGSFSAYQLCDSRVYEYLIPTYCFLPPHPESFLGKELPKLAEEAEDLAGYQERQGEVSSFWKETEENLVKPFLEGLDSELSESIRKALYDVEPTSVEIQPDTVSTADVGTSEAKPADTEVQPINPQVPCAPDLSNTAQSVDGSDHQPSVSAPDSSTVRAGDSSGEAQKPKEGTNRAPSSPFETALKQLKHIIIARKKTYRIDPKRLARVQSVLNQYVGTHNFHNYTISKLSRDPSAKRVIKSFTVAPKPIIINETEWLSLKVHGQSFMMHQIRKMVTMAALIVRCGCPEERMNDSYGHDKLTLPKAPSLGLLLERPVFDSYNSKMRGDDVEGKGEVGFEKYEKEIAEFKQREIYERIFREEDAQDTFHTFFASLDSVRRPDLLYLSSLGVTAARRQTAEGEEDTKSVEQIIPEVSDDEGEDANGQEG
ncbi:tRNA pseudouridine synthase 1, variant 2 [Xanthoria parietina]